MSLRDIQRGLYVLPLTINIAVLELGEIAWNGNSVRTKESIPHLPCVDTVTGAASEGQGVQYLHGISALSRGAIAYSEVSLDCRCVNRKLSWARSHIQSLQQRAALADSL